MKTENLISLYQGTLALEGKGLSTKQIKLKKHEAITLETMCNDLINCNCTIEDFDGFITNYTIKQIGKEFDLLRFSDSLIINIELKSKFNANDIEKKISKQLRENYYYLNSLGIPLRLFSYIENTTFLEYDIQSKKIIRITSDDVASALHQQKVNYTLDPDNLFVPSNYLISPFNTTQKFMKNEYFLTTQQQEIKDNILSLLSADSFFYYYIHANAGTGKTLLIYDIAKEIKSIQKNVTIIHCGYTNIGQTELSLLYDWSIKSIKDIRENSIGTILDQCDVLILDETQRISDNQLDLIINNTIIRQIPVIFSYDVKQKLKKSEGKNIQEYINSNHPEIPSIEGKLTNKIRTNKEIASFITNLFSIGKSNSYQDYDNIYVDYFDNMSDLKRYIDFLSQSGWTVLTYTPSIHSPSDPFSKFSCLSELNSHTVIGQEFPNVVCIMDSTFYYKGNNLNAYYTYYNALGMLYENVTRVINKLMIIVYDNPYLFEKILNIKNHESI